MKIDGKEFLRNVGIEEDKLNLKKAQEKLEEQKREFKQKDHGFFDNDPLDDDSVSLNLSSNSSFEDKSINNLHDIRLDPDSNGNSKKKYIILIASLILLFIITIVIIRIISNNQEEKKLSQPAASQTIEKDNQLDNIKIRTPMNSIIGFSNLLKEDELTQTQREFLDLLLKMKLLWRKKVSSFQNP